MTIWKDEFDDADGSAIGRSPDITDGGEVYTAYSKSGVDYQVLTTGSGYLYQANSGSSEQVIGFIAMPSGSANVIVKAEVWDKASVVADSAGVGVSARVSDASNGFCAIISKEQNWFKLRKVEAGVRTDLDSDSLAIADSTIYKIHLECNGNSIEARLYDNGDTLLSTLTATDSFNNTEEDHGAFFGNIGSANSRVYLLEAEEAAVLNPVVDPNGYDITVNSTNTTPSNFEVKINGGSAINPASVVERTPSTVRLRMPNANRILSTDTVTVTDTAGGFTDVSADNSNNVQTANAVVIPLKGGGTRSINFASAPTVGISRAGVLQYTNAINVTSITETYADGEEQFRGDNQLNPDIGDFNFGDAALSFPYTPAENDAIVARVHLPETTSRADSTAVSVGDVILKNGVFYRIEDGDAGTTAGSEPSFPSSTPNTVTDGTATWTAMEGRGYQLRSPIVKAAYAVCAGSSLKSQDLYAPAPWAGCDKTWRDSADINTGVLPGDTISGATSVSDAEDIVSDLWYDLGTVESSPKIPGLQYPGYGRDISSEWAKVVTSICSDASYTTVLLDLIIQRGIEQRGIREIGGHWPANGGWSQGRLSAALIAGRVLEDETAWIAALKTNANTSINWGGTEFANQVFYVDADDIARTLDSKYQYGDNGVGGKVYLAPNTDPSTLTPQADAPANAYSPADIRNNWLHTPEWGIRHDTDPDRDTPLWNFNDVEASYYRRCCTAGYWGYLVYLIDALGITSAVDAPAFVDYVRRYEHIQGPSGANSNWENANLWTLFEANQGAIVALAVPDEDGLGVTVTFTRDGLPVYVTASDADWLNILSFSGSPTLSNPEHVGPNEWHFDTDSDCTGDTLTLTAGASGSNAVDAGNNAVPTQARGAGEIVDPFSQVNVDGTLRWTATRASGLWGSEPRADADKINSLSQDGVPRSLVGDPTIQGAGTSTLQIVMTVSPPFYSPSNGDVAIDFAQAFVIDENGVQTAATTAFDQGDNSSTQEPAATGGGGGARNRSRSRARSTSVSNYT